MKTSDDNGASGRAMRAAMEQLISGMKVRRPVRRKDLEGDTKTLSLGGDTDGGLAAAPWSAVAMSSLAPYERPTSLPRGTSVGRHVVLDELGAGGMGVVYAAFDPELDRKVALKLVRPGASHPSTHARLLREAKALAKLSHPNVVAIHDVGTVDEQVWLAMEFVEGQTLSAWLETPRRWTEVLAVMRAAGEGLAAAHSVGLLHRDFKPDNVMIDHDGRVRVMDFGLARTRSRNAQQDTDERGAAPEVDGLAMSVTETGTIVGTPRYMAPEQFENTELTAAADQFAFCVTTWEALYGERPFGGSTWREISEHVGNGRLQTPKHPRGVPSWLRRVCERGLLVEPQQRWPSMSTLLDTLAKGRTRARVRKGLVAMAVLAGLGAAVAGQHRYDVAQRTAACEASGAAIETAWNPAREQALREALVGTGVSYAATTADELMPWLDRQASEWREARVEACLDTEVRGRWDAEMLVRSSWCLDDRRARLESLVAELLAADRGVVQQAVKAVAELASVRPCRDPKALELLPPPPTDRREAIREVGQQVIEANTYLQTGRYEPALARSGEALAGAEALRWPPLVAEARIVRGESLEKLGDHAAAEPVLEDAYFEALGSTSPDLAFDAALKLVYVVGYQLGRPAEGRRWGRLAEAALASTQDPEGMRSSRLLGSLAILHATAGEYGDARKLLEEALRSSEQAMGSNHLDLATLLDNLANVQYSTDAYDEARASSERALAIREEALGPDHPDVARSLNHLGSVLVTTGHTSTAKPLLERALAIRVASLGPEHPLVARSYSGLGDVLLAEGDLAGARASFERAVTITENAMGPEHPALAGHLDNLASAHVMAHDYPRAQATYERGLVIAEKALGPKHPTVATLLTGLARVLLLQQRPGDALALAERAVDILEEHEMGLELATARFCLAQALWEAPQGGGRDRARARVSAEQARESLEKLGPSGSESVATVGEWLDEHPREE